MERDPAKNTPKIRYLSRQEMLGLNITRKSKVFHMLSTLR